MTDSYSVSPIDIDFAGWSTVQEGQHNSWGIIHDATQTLRYHTSCPAAARLKADALNERIIPHVVIPSTHLRGHWQSENAT
jgi:hypothetical protein